MFRAFYIYSSHTIAYMKHVVYNITSGHSRTICFSVDETIEHVVHTNCMCDAGRRLILYIAALASILHASFGSYAEK